jgi:hypothetical protein
MSGMPTQTSPTRRPLFEKTLSCIAHPTLRPRSPSSTPSTATLAGGCWWYCWRGPGLLRIDRLTDVYNARSVVHLIPMGDRPVAAEVKCSRRRDPRDHPPYVILTFAVLFVFSMQGTIGPLVWLLLAEILPLKIRSFAMGVCVFCLWITNAGVAFGFPPVVQAIGIAPTFFIFAGLGVLALIFIATMVPETRGVTLEEFEDSFKASNS